MTKKAWIKQRKFHHDLLLFARQRAHMVRDWLAERGSLAAQISQCLEVGTYYDYDKDLKVHGPCVAIVTSGMDCDCSAWSNRVTLVPAMPIYVARWIEQFYADAEGPQSYQLMKPSKAAKLKEGHRDLALEAFEDGHPHSVTYTPAVNAMGLTDGEVYDG